MTWYEKELALRKASTYMMSSPTSLAIARRGTTDVTSSYGQHIPQQGLSLDAISPTQKVEDATLLWLTRHGYKAYE